MANVFLSEGQRRARLRAYHQKESAKILVEWFMALFILGAAAVIAIVSLPRLSDDLRDGATIILVTLLLIVASTVGRHAAERITMLTTRAEIRLYGVCVECREHGEHVRECDDQLCLQHPRKETGQ